MTSSEAALRGEIVEVMQKMAARGLNRGTSGNVSARCGEGLLVTPSGVEADALTPEAIVYLDRQGRAAPDALAPSTEWRMHRTILARRPDVSGVVHCHSHYATVLACVRKPVPSMHYMVSVTGGTTIDVADYHSFGTDALAEAVVTTLAGRLACLMANHGQIAVAPTLRRALAIAEQVEELAAMYWGALAIGGPVLLSDAQMADVIERFKGYGQARRDERGASTGQEATADLTSPK